MPIPKKLNHPDLSKHLLRRMTFAATPELLAGVENKSPIEATDWLLEQSDNAPPSQAPDFVSQEWANPALRLQTTPLATLDAANQRAAGQYRAEAEQVQSIWLNDIVRSSGPVRENLALLFHRAFGGSYKVIGPGHAMWLHIDLLRRSALGNIPDMLEALVLDPAMMIQYGYDESRRELPPYHAAKKILDHWLVGVDNYSDSDAEHLARALTGWILEAPDGRPLPENLDTRGSRDNRRTGLVPNFHPEHFDNGTKRILGQNGTFDAPSAVKTLAMHPLSATMYAGLFIEYFGVRDPEAHLQGKLADEYLASRGDTRHLLRTLVSSTEFWSNDSRWNLVKSPVHMAVGSCRTLGITDLQDVELINWLRMCGQDLMSSPGRGAQPWPQHDEWLQPAHRLTARYQLGDVLLNHPLTWGLRDDSNAVSAYADKAPEWIYKLSSTYLRTNRVAHVVGLLDAAPGLDMVSLERSSRASNASLDQVATTIKRVVASPVYQLA